MLLSGSLKPFEIFLSVPPCYLSGHQGCMDAQYKEDKDNEFF